jgi:biopolymer transport protein ExbD
MKRDQHTASNDDAQVDMTPMLDIVFIMLIFFIVTTTFANEKGLFANRPDNVKCEGCPSNALNVSIDEQGQILMNGRVVDIRRVAVNVQTFLAENDSTSAGIIADESTEHGVVVEVMDQIRFAGIKNVSLLVK